MHSQTDASAYKKRVLETSEIDLLFSYYGQDGNNAAVTGGQGTEELTDATSSVVVRIPMNEDDVLTVDVGISAYTSASSSNVNPLDGDPNRPVSPFSASSGASRSDQLIHFNPSYQHSSEDRNSVWTGNVYVASEYDYFSVGAGGSYAHLFNEKNTEFSIGANVFLDKWNPQYPIELRTGFFDSRTVGNGMYDPMFQAFTNENRNSYSLSLGLSQILGKKLQGSVFMDVVLQNGLLSTPFQRVYFNDTENFFIGEFQLADDVERLPDSRLKIPIGARLNYYLNDRLIVRSYYRFYYDDWGITGHTANLEIPVKLSDSFTIYPSYRFYSQTAADYFYQKEAALSTFDFYTSDYDLSEFNAHQYGMGLRYKDIFTRASIFSFGLKTVDLRLNKYDRSDGLSSYIVTLGTTFLGN
ncbi:DUF3570 domain-containing protein [Flavobacteriaceae bacterium TP-CH-4]|uniref:DUF3570 domain-containing protein n=1 Tax=Pelagihabitans pacificus TaxID=2696054 RepID=A0A967APF4_9FLAO|nr:DUF3570 domain-containing protein [Pelagihabitans pacificus]NHF57929.1 DUF3570 domain-containing protein [Pelagihabitans pacificus]